MNCILGIFIVQRDVGEQAMQRLKNFYHRVGNFVDYCVYELLFNDNGHNPGTRSGKTCTKCHKKCGASYLTISGQGLMFCSKECYEKAFEQFERYQETLGKTRHHGRNRY